MKRKRTKKDRKQALDKESWSDDRRKERRKKTKKSASGGRSSSPPQFQSQHEDTVIAPRSQSELQPQDCASIPVPVTGKVNAQTQTTRNTKNRHTQTESINHNSCHTQTESDPRCEATIQGQKNTENVSPKTNEEKGADDSVPTPPDPGGDEKEGTTTPSSCEEVMKEEDIKNKKGKQTGKDPQDSSNPKSTETKPKSYAEAASGKDSKEKTNQTAAGQEGKTHDKAAQR